MEKINCKELFIFVPDEEMGGSLGMDPYVASEDFRALNIGYALDEGMPSMTRELTVINDERCTWRMEFICHGITGHGSILFENSTGEKIPYLIEKMMERRQVELDNMKNLNLTTYANVTTINLTVLKGGVQGNVIPPELSVTFDVRLSVNADHDEFENQLNQWCEEAGGNITINYIIKDAKATRTVADNTNPLWVVMEKTARETNVTVVPGVVTGATDARFLRRLNINAFGFSTLINTPTLAHAQYEYVHADIYLNGINIYKQLILNLDDIEEQN